MNNKKTIISAAAVIAVAATVFAVASMNRANNAPTVTVSLPATSATIDTTTSRYKNGTYTAIGSYQSPGGLDDVGVTLSLKNDIITSVSFTPMAHDATSARYQAIFANGFQSLVVGKNISSVYLDAVSGSSLTGQGFNDALAQIKAQAKA